MAVPTHADPLGSTQVEAVALLLKECGEVERNCDKLVEYVGLNAAALKGKRVLAQWRAGSALAAAAEPDGSGGGGGGGGPAAAAVGTRTLPANCEGGIGQYEGQLRGGKANGQGVASFVHPDGSPHAGEKYEGKCGREQWCHFAGLSLPSSGGISITMFIMGGGGGQHDEQQRPD